MQTKTKLTMKSLFSLFTLVVFGLTCVAQIPSYVPSDGLVGWYPFNGNANDESGVSANGEMYSLETAEDRFGNANSAFYFSGSNCTPHIETNIDFQGSSEGMTISYWLNRQGSGCIYPRLVGFWSGGNTPQSWGMAWGNSGVLDYMDESPANNQWHHVLVTLDADSIHAYLNGELKGAYGSNYQPPLASYMSIGRMTHPAYDAFNGYMDDFGIWNRVLLPEEIESMYESDENPSVEGCMDDTACNFNPEATEDDGSCEFAPSWTTESEVTVCLGDAYHFPETSDPCIENLGTPNNWPWPPFEEIGAISLGNFGTPNVFSLSFSVNPSDNLPGIHVLFDASHGGSSNWVLQKLSGQWRFLDATLPLVDNEWQDVLIQYDNCQVSIYIDDVLVDETFWCINYNANPQWYLGNWPEGGRRFKGSVDDVLLTHGILSWEDRELGASAPNAVQYFPFDEGLGEFSQDQVTGEQVNLYQWMWSNNESHAGDVTWLGFEGTSAFYPSADTTLTYQWTGAQCTVENTMLLYVDDGCADESACNFDAAASCLIDCIYPILGATNCEDGLISCGPGTIWNPELQHCEVELVGDSNFDGCLGAEDLLTTLANFGNCNE